MADVEYWDAYTGEPLYKGDLIDRYDEMLDEVFPAVRIGECEYDVSRILAEVDPIAYRCGFNDWLDGEIGESITDTDPENGE